MTDETGSEVSTEDAAPEVVVEDPPAPDAEQTEEAEPAPEPQAAEPGQPPAGPPYAPRRPVERVLHGVTDVDEFHWMRDHDDPELVDNLVAEREWYDARTARLAPLREQLYRRMAELTPAEEPAAPWFEGGYEYTWRVPAGQEYPVLTRRAVLLPEELEAEGGVEPEPEVLLDVNVEAAGHEYAEVGLRLVSPDGAWLAWSLDTTGDEVYRLQFRDLRTGRDRPDHVGRSYYSGAWAADSRSFFYVEHDHLYRPFRVLRHVLGTDPYEDDEIFRENDQAFDVEVRATRSGGFVVIRTFNRDTAECLLIPSARPFQRPVVVLPRRKAVEYDVDHCWAPGAFDGGGGPGRLLLTTDDGAPEFQLLAAELPALDPSATDLAGAAGMTTGDLTGLDWQPLVPGRDDVRVHAVEPFADCLVLVARHGGRTLLEIREPDGALRHSLTSPAAEGTLELAENEEYSADVLTVVAQSLVEPRTWYDVDTAGGGLTARVRAEVPQYDPAQYVTERFEAKADDGAIVPVTVARHRDTRVDGTAPCLLYGYGSYESVLDPEFDPAVTALLDQGVVYAVAHIRGGGENGRRWWLGGRLHTKPTTFTDFVSCGRALVAAGYAATGRLAIRGLSAGGLLMGASLGLAPALWRAVVAEVPFVDVVNSMLDADIPLTVNEWDEWGNPRKPDDFAVMRAYSPYDNPPEGHRPELLVTGTLHDPRVLVHEPAKWVARLRATAQDPPGAGDHVLFRAEVGEGAHSGPTGRYARLGYEAEVLAWVLDRVALPVG